MDSLKERCWIEILIVIGQANTFEMLKDFFSPSSVFPFSFQNSQHVAPPHVISNEVLFS